MEKAREYIAFEIEAIQRNELMDLLREQDPTAEVVVAVDFREEEARSVSVSENGKVIIEG